MCFRAYLVVCMFAEYQLHCRDRMFNAMLTHTTSLHADKTYVEGDFEVAEGLVWQGPPPPLATIPGGEPNKQTYYK